MILKEAEKDEFTEDFEGFIQYADEQFQIWTGTKKVDPVKLEEEVKVECYHPKTIKQRQDEIKRIYSIGAYKKRKKSKKNEMKIQSFLVNNYDAFQLTDELFNQRF